MTDPASNSSPSALTPAQRRPVRPKYQVFISSTFMDLEDARKKVTWELLKAGHIPVGMENFSANDERGWRTIQRTIDTSDYYVLIVGGRYGTVDDTIGMSWTEREYRYAKERGVPVLAFIRDSSHVTVDKIDRGKSAERLEEFVKAIRNSHLCEKWTTEEDLCSRVAQAVRKAIDEAEFDGIPRPGWYRGDQLPSPTTLDELAALSTENRKLRAQVDAFARPGQVILEVLDAHGNVPVNVEITRPFYTYEIQSRESDSHGLLPVLQLSDIFEEQFPAFVNDINRTYWLSLYLRNSGNKVARNTIVDIDIDGAVAIVLGEERLLPGISNVVSNKVQSRWMDPSEHVYVDYRKEREGGILVRQRAKQVAVSASESLIPMGLRGSSSPDSQLRFTVKYRAVSEDGESTEGSFTIGVARTAHEPLTVADLKKKFR